MIHERRWTHKRILGKEEFLLARGHLPTTVHAAVAVIFGDRLGGEFDQVFDRKALQSRLKTLVVRGKKYHRARGHDFKDITDKFRMILVDIK